MSDFVKGDKVVVKSGEGFANEGATGTVEAVDGPHWLQVKWDEPKGDRIDGYYVKASFEKVEAKAVDLTVAIAALVDKTREEATAAAKAEVAKNQISDADKQTLQVAFAKLNDYSAQITRILQNNKII